MPARPPRPRGAQAQAHAQLADPDRLEAGALVDGFARRVRYLRISVTDRCNYHCTYCRPPEDLAFGAREELLSFEELEHVVTVFARLGVRKLRLTGGEPTVRAGIVELVARLAAVPGIEQVVMTTNGHLLGRLAEPLARAGLRAVNVSLDTLDAQRFAELTGGDLGKVLEGIDAARAASLTTKINIVALAAVNRDEIGALCRFAWERQIVPRFIEHMPMSAGALYAAANELSAAELRALIERAHGPLVPSSAVRRDGGPSRYWHLGSDPAREVGIISAMTEHFCDDCNRVRLTAAGELHACLGHDDAVSLRDVLRAGGDAEARQAALISAISWALGGKRAGHEFSRTGTGAPKKHMISMGG